MKELNRFREFLAEKEIKEYYGPDIKIRRVTQNDWPLKWLPFPKAYPKLRYLDT